MNAKSFSAVLLLLLGSALHAQDSINFLYRPTTGDVWIESSAGPMSTLEIKSGSEQFSGEPYDQLQGLFDVSTAAKVFKLEPAGFTTLNLSGLLPAGLTCEDLVTDLSFDGSIAAAGGPFPRVVLGPCFPEPSSGSMLAIGGLVLTALNRNRRN